MHQSALSFTTIGPEGVLSPRQLAKSFQFWLLILLIVRYGGDLCEQSAFRKDE
jgi:hypothetical protein